MEKHENHDAHAVDGMLEAIDRGEKNSVYVISVEDGADVAGMGGPMATAMAEEHCRRYPIEGKMNPSTQAAQVFGCLFRSRD